MGEDAARAAGFVPRVLGRPAEPSSSDDTRAAAERLSSDVELLVLAGGDGTVRDVLGVLPRRCRCWAFLRESRCARAYSR